LFGNGIVVRSVPHTEGEKMMKCMSTLGIVSLIGMMLFAGCAPSITVIPAGQEQRYEVTVRASEFAVEETEELIQAWHQKAGETCGGKYTLIHRDVTQQGEPFGETLITGIVECQ
jgi:hypothetical protein